MSSHLSTRIKDRLEELYVSWARMLYEPWLFECMQRGQVLPCIMIRDFYRVSCAKTNSMRGQQPVRINWTASDKYDQILNYLADLTELYRALSKRIPIPLVRARQMMTTFNALKEVIEWEPSDLNRWEFIMLEFNETTKFYEQRSLNDTFRGIPIDLGKNAPNPGFKKKLPKSDQA